ncbi:MAG: hypothetical protein QXN37_02795 [Candidatus Anstonellaceae archaeon]
MFIEPFAPFVVNMKNTPSPKQIHDALMALGVSDLDAGLIADCINVGKSTTWMNNDPVPEEINQKLQDFIKKYDLCFSISVTPVKMDKFIWEVKRLG